MTFKEYLKENYKNGVYISLKLTNKSKVIFNNFLKEHLKNQKTTPDPHCTLIYSKKAFNGLIKTKNNVYKAQFDKFTIFGDDTLVAKLECPEMLKRNKELTEEYNFISDFDTYQPHITLMYKNGKSVIKSLPNLPNLEFDNEKAEALDLNWS